MSHNYKESRGTDERCCGACRFMINELDDGFGECANAAQSLDCVHCSDVCDIFDKRPVITIVEVGETFTEDGVEYICVKDTPGFKCSACGFNDNEELCNKYMCLSGHRNDKLWVHFEKLKNNDE